MAIKQIVKNKREVVRITPTKFQGLDLVDIRIYAPTKETNELVPTRKGITVAVDVVPDLIEALTWALGQECSDDGRAVERMLSSDDADRLARDVWEALYRHGSAVHWDSAERIVLNKLRGFSKWDLHYVLTTRRDLFEHVDVGCFRARKP